MDVRMPDGTVITNVPEGITQTELLARYKKSKAMQEPQSDKPVADFLYDVGQGIVMGGGHVIKDMGQLAGMMPFGNPNNPITRQGEHIIAAAQANMSSRGQYDAAQAQARIQQAEQEEGQWSAAGQTIKELVTNPRYFAIETSKQIPQVIPSILAGGTTRAAMILRGVEPTKKAIMTAVIGTGATQQSADVAGEVFDEALKATGDPETAKARSIQAFLASVPASVASQFVAGSGGRAFERVLGGVEGRQMGAKAFVKALIGETAQEVTEETSGQLITNIQAQRLDPNIPLERGMGQTAGQAGAMGALYGGVGGVRETLTAPRANTTSPLIREDIEALRKLYTDRKNAEYEAAGPEAAGVGQEIIGQQFGGIRPNTDLELQTGERVRAKRIGEQGMSMEGQKVPVPSGIVIREGTPTLPSKLVMGDERMGTIVPQAVVNWLKTDLQMTKKRPDLVEIANKIEKYLPPGLQIKIPSERGFKSTFTTNGGRGVGNIAGFFLPPHNTIYMRIGGLDAQTLTHELVHAASEYAVARWSTVENGKAVVKPGAPKQIQGLADVYNYITSTASGLDLHHYGMTNISEMLSEAFTNPIFSGYLQKVQMPDSTQSVWRRLVSYLAELFGVEQIDAFGTILTMGQAAMEYQKANLEALQKYTFRTWPRAEHATIKEAANKTLDGDIAIEEQVTDDKHQPTDLEDAKEKPFERLGIDTGRIPDDPDVKDPGLIQRILQDQDGSAKWDWAYPGALQAADIRNSVLIRTVYRLMDNATKRAKKFERDFITPLENTWSKLLRKRDSTMRLLGVFKLELELGENLPEEDLSRILNKEEIAAYKDMRDVLEMSWKAQNEALVAVKLKPLTKLESYYAARWRGPFRSVLRNKDGKIVWVIAERSRKQAEQALTWIKKRHPDLLASEITTYKGRGTEDTLVAGYLELVKLLDMDDPSTMALHDEWKKAIIGTTENVQGQEKHFKRKTGVEGYAGARPWVDQYLDAKEFFIEQIKYMKAAAKWSAMQEPARRVKDLLSNEEIAKSQKNNVKYAKAYLRNHLGYSTAKWIQAAEDALVDVFGRDSEFAENIIGGMKTLFYVMQLGYNVPYSIYAAIQPMLGAGKHASLTSDGYHHNLGKTVMLAFRDGLAFSLAHLGRWMSHVAVNKAMKQTGETMDTMFRKFMTENGQIATEYIEANGVVDVTPTTDIMDLRVPAWVGKARDWGGWTISAVEILSRSMAFYSFVHHLAQSDKRNLLTDDILILADDSTKDIMADYRPSERALIFNNTGLAGKGLATLQTFKFNWMAQTLKYWKLGQTKGQWRPFVMQMSTYFLLAGAAGFIGIDDADDLWRYMLSQLSDEEFAKWKDYSPKMILMRKMPSLLAYGLVSGATGTNIYTRGSLGDILPFNPQKGVLDNSLNFFPFLSTSAYLGMGIVRGGMEMMGVGNRDTNLAAIHKGMPATLKGPYEVMSGSYETDGVLTSLNDPSLGVYRRTDADRTARMWGLRTLRETQATEGRYRHRDIKAETDKRRGAAGNDFWSAALKGDNRNAVDYLNRYIELGGDPRHLLTVSRMQESQKRLVLDYAEQLMVRVKPQNRAAVREFIEYMMFYSPTYEE